MSNKLILIFLFVVACTVETIAGNFKQINFIHKTLNEPVSIGQIDTSELADFWNKFQNAAIHQNESFLVKNMTFPLYGGDIATLNFAKSCDSLEFEKQSEKWDTLRITSENFSDYYQYYFNEHLIELIQAISIEDIAKNGEDTGFSFVYGFMPEGKFKCSNVAVLTVNLFYKDNDFSVALTVCC